MNTGNLHDLDLTLLNEADRTRLISYQEDGLANNNEAKRFLTFIEKLLTLNSSQSIRAKLGFIRADVHLFLYGPVNNRLESPGITLHEREHENSKQISK